MGGVASKARARITPAVRQVFARNPDWRMRTKPRGRMCWTKRRRDSMAGERHRATLVAMGVVLVGEGHVVAVEGDQPVVADRHAMGVATEIPQDGGRAAEGRLGVDDPVGLEEGVDEGPQAERSRRCSVPPARSSSLRSYARRNASTNFPRKTRLRTFTGRMKPGYLG